MKKSSSVNIFTYKLQDLEIDELERFIYLREQYKNILTYIKKNQIKIDKAILKQYNIIYMSNLMDAETCIEKLILKYWGNIHPLPKHNFDLKQGILTIEV